MQIGSLAGPHRERGQIASRHGILIRPLGIGVHGELAFPGPASSVDRPRRAP